MSQYLMTLEFLRTYHFFFKATTFEQAIKELKKMGLDVVVGEREMICLVITDKPAGI